jgi:ABC-type molybdate transport system substrate-binding protein
MPGTQDWIAVVKATKQLAAANAYVKLVLSSKGQSTLKAAGFGAP